jgi:hypothetical protein
MPVAAARFHFRKADTEDCTKIIAMTSITVARIGDSFKLCMFPPCNDILAEMDRDYGINTWSWMAPFPVSERFIEPSCGDAANSLLHRLQQ